MSGESQREPFADLPLLGELRERLEARFRAAEQQPLSRGASARPPLRRRWLARHSRLLAVLGVLLLAAGTATAAITLGGTPSQAREPVAICAIPEQG